LRAGVASLRSSACLAGFFERGLKLSLRYCGHFLETRGLVLVEAELIEIWSHSLRLQSGIAVPPAVISLTTLGHILEKFPTPPF
jgi:hypothetical protein